MRICHIITRLIIGGAQENTLLTCEGLHRKGHEVSLISGPETGPEGSLWDRARSGGYEVVEFPSMVRAVRPLTDWSCLTGLTQLLRRIRPHVVHTHSSKAGILGRMAARRAGMPIIVHTIHGMSFNRTQSWPVRMLYRRLERYAAGFTDKLVCVADAMTEQAVSAKLAAREKFVTVYSGIQTGAFDPDGVDQQAVRQRLGIPVDRVLVGTVARLFARKGYEQLIPAMPEMARGRNLHFLWVGDGPHRDEFVSELERRGLRDRVTLTGLVPPEDVPALVGACDILVHTSQWEGLPRVLAQAGLMRVPVVSFDNDGAPEAVRPGVTGFLTPFNQQGPLVQAVHRLADNPDLRLEMGHEARRHCLARFDHQVMVGALERLYQDLQNSR